MKQNNAIRKSHCSICGKRLSEKTASNTIRWKPGYVDDAGIHCDSCHTTKKSSKDQGSDHS